MDIWPPPPQNTGYDTTQSIEPPNTLAAIALGIPAGLLGGVIISVAVWIVKSFLDRHSMTLKLPGYLYFLAVPIEIGLCRVVYPKNKVFALASGITAVCVSTLLAIVCVILDGLSELD